MDTASAFLNVLDAMSGGEPKYQRALHNALADITQSYEGRTALLRAGQTLRLPSGYRGLWRGGPEGKPSEAERTEAQQRLRPFKESMRSHCPCCERSFLLATEWASVKEHGVCASCALYVVWDKVDGVMRERPPTVEEALAIPPEDLRRGEAAVIRNALIERMKGA